MKTGRRSCWGAAGLVLLAVWSGACGGGEKRGARPTQGAPGDGPRRGGTLVAGVIADLGSPNVYATLSTAMTQEVVSLLYLRLVEELPDFQEHPPTIGPMLAESWELAPDRRSFTFTLRDDVVWSDGRPVTADDVRFSWQAQTDPDVLWDSAYYKEGIRDVEVLDPRTVRFHLTRVAAQELLNINEGEIVPAHAWSELPFARWRSESEWFLDRIVVDGPYTLESWTPQQEIVLVRNERYHEPGKPYIDRVIMRFIADRASLVTLLLSGELDIVMGLAESDVGRIERAPNIDLVTHWGRGLAFVAWNGRNPLFAEPEIRRALTLAIDRETIVEAIYGPYGKVAVSPVLTSFWAFNRELEPWPYDPAAARRILAEHGWRDADGDGVVERDGRRFSFELATNIGNQQRIDAAVMIQEQLSRVGIDAQVRTMAFNPLMERAFALDYDALLTRWGMPTDHDMTFAFHSSSIKTANNIFAYSNPEADRLMEAAQGVERLEDLAGYLDPLQEIIHRDQPMTLLWENQEIGAFNRRVHFGDQPPNVLRRFWHLWDWWLDPQ